MYDTSFDHDGATPVGCRALWALRLLGAAAVIGLSLSAAAEGQLPGAPVLQNAWATPGIVGAVDFGHGSDGGVYAAALAWTPGAGRFQISGGAGFQSRTGYSSRGVYGARVALPFGGATSSFGFGAFAGIGGGSAGTRTGGALADSAISTMQIPVGAALGWRHAIGPTHGVSVYATPSYLLFAGGSSTGGTNGAGSTKSTKGLFRTAIGGDLGITRAIGATVGVEFGQSRGRGVGGPSGALYGLGLSYALGRR
jgi:hypothetical protein